MIKTILVILPNKVGDMVLSIPFIKALEKEYPDSHIGVAAPSHIAELAKIIREIDYTHPFTKKQYNKLLGKMKIGRSILKQRRYDLCFCLPHSFSAALLAFFSGSRMRIGFQTEGRKLLLTHPYTHNEHVVHSAKDALHLLERHTGNKQHEKSYELTPEAEFVSKKLPKGPLLVFNGNSAKQSTRIPPSKIKKIIKSILEIYECTVLMVGGPDEYEEVQAIIDQLSIPERVLNFAGLGLIETASIMRTAGALISTDTGLAHLGNAVGAKTIVFFGAVDERIASPWNKEKLRIIRKDGLECAPCHKQICPFGEPICLTKLDTNLILTAIEQWTKIPKKTASFFS